MYKNKMKYCYTHTPYRLKSNPLPKFKNLSKELLYIYTI